MTLEDFLSTYLGVDEYTVCGDGKMYLTLTAQIDPPVTVMVMPGEPVANAIRLAARQMDKVKKDGTGWQKEINEIRVRLKARAATPP